MEQKDYDRIEAFRQLKKQIRGSNDYLVIGISVWATAWKDLTLFTQNVY